MQDLLLSKKMHVILFWYTGWAKKSGATDSWTYNSVKSQPIYKKNPRKFLGKFIVKWILKLPAHLVWWVATLPCETLMSAKQAINDKQQGSVATYIRCDGVVNTKLRKVYCRVCEWKFAFAWPITGKHDVVHMQNRKSISYITYRNATRGGPRHSHRQHVQKSW